MAWISPIFVLSLFVSLTSRQAAAFTCKTRCPSRSNFSSVRAAPSKKSGDDNGNHITTLGEVSRSNALRRMLIGVPAVFLSLGNSPVNAAPPFAIMAEEMGYFPVTDERTGETVMVPAKAKRQSTDQAMELAKYLQSTGAKMYGAFWCPHCQRQKELFGKDAWKYINYVECSPKGYRSQFALCMDEGVDGYPTWKFGNGKSQGGEMELIEIAKLSGFLKKKGAKSFDASLEVGVPSLGGGECQ